MEAKTEPVTVHGIEEMRAWLLANPSNPDETGNEARLDILSVPMLTSHLGGCYVRFSIAYYEPSEAQEAMELGPYDVHEYPCWDPNERPELAGKINADGDPSLLAADTLEDAIDAIKLRYPSAGWRLIEPWVTDPNLDMGADSPVHIVHFDSLGRPNPISNGWMTRYGQPRLMTKYGHADQPIPDEELPLAYIAWRKELLAINPTPTWAKALWDDNVKNY